MGNLAAYRAAGRWLVLLSIGLLCSCYPLHQPLVDPAKAKPDERLYGTWKFVPGKEEDPTGYEYLFIGDLGDNYVPAGMMKGVSVSCGPKSNSVRVDTFFFFQASIGQSGYLHLIDNARPSASGFMQWDQSTAKYFLVKYVITNDRLTLQLMDLAAAAKVVTAGQLKGTVTERGILKIKEVEITEGAQGLRRFLEGKGDKLFFPDKAEKAVFTKVK